MITLPAFIGALFIGVLVFLIFLGLYFIAEKKAFVAIGAVFFVVFLFIGFAYNKCDNCGEHNGVHKISCSTYHKIHGKCDSLCEIKNECCNCGKTIVIINASENNSSDELILCEVCKEKITNISTINNVKIIDTNKDIVKDFHYCFECGSLNKKTNKFCPDCGTNLQE